jgi:hypothetical protein
MNEHDQQTVGSPLPSTLRAKNTHYISGCALILIGFGQQKLWVNSSGSGSFPNV